MDYDSKEEVIESLLEKTKDSIFPSENNNYRSKFLESKWLLRFAVLLLVLKMFVTVIPLNVPSNIFFADVTKSYLENSLNQTRQSMGLQPLAQNAQLDAAAQMKAQDMVAQQYFNHTSPSGVSPWYWFTKAGYVYKYAGENLAIGFFDSEEVYNAWLNSPEHKANIVNPNYTQVGTAVLGGFGPNNSIVVVQEFGSPAVAKTAVAVKNNVPKPVAVKTNPVNVQPVAVNVAANERVLSQSTESAATIKASTGTATGNTSAKILNAVVYNYGAFLQNIIYGVSSIVIGMLLLLIFFNFHITFKRQLVYRALLILVLLFTATMINSSVILSLIPHKVSI